MSISPKAAQAFGVEGEVVKESRRSKALSIARSSGVEAGYCSTSMSTRQRWRRDGLASGLFDRCESTRKV
jgi:hypothetical protein